MFLNKSLKSLSLLVIYQLLLLALVSSYICTTTTTATSPSTSESNSIHHPFIVAHHRTKVTQQRQHHQKQQTIDKFHHHTSTVINMASTTSASSSNQNGSTSINTESNGSNYNPGIAHLLARSNILELQPYRCARDDYSTGILLDANENSYGPASSVKEQIQKQHSSSSTIIELERYPDPYQIPLKERLIEFRGYNENTNYQSHGKKITANHIFVGVGSDEAIDLLMRIFCIPQTDSIMTTPPTYGMYKVCAKVNDISIVTVPLTPQFDVEIDKVSLLCLTWLV
jgi:Aminotransferase class I and II